MIYSVNFSLFRTSESVQFFNDLVQLCLSNNPESLNIQKPYRQLEQIANSLNAGFKNEKGSDITTELSNLDARRDNAITCLRTITEGFTNHFEPSKQMSAKLLLNTIDKYGKSISRLNYQAETSTISNLAVELQSVNSVKEWVNTLGLDDVVADMLEANNAFNERFLARIREEAEKEQVALGEKIKEAVGTYRVLTAHIEAHATLNPSEELTALMKQLNELIDGYNLLVNQRSNNTKIEV